MEELKGRNVPIKVWARVAAVESGALDRLKAIAALPWVARHVAVMPDLLAEARQTAQRMLRALSQEPLRRAFSTTSSSRIRAVLDS